MLRGALPIAAELTGAAKLPGSTFTLEWPIADQC
jgi:hypothetical protein